VLSVRTRFAVSLAVAGLLWLPAVSRAQSQQGQEQGDATVAREISSALAEVAAGNVAVTYESGQLTIKAQSARLIDVLRAVCSQIGAELDPSSEPDEPVFGVFGPGPSREVLAGMMGGSNFNLAMAGSPDDPNAIMRILILAKSADSADKTNSSSDASPTEDSLAQSKPAEQPTSQAVQVGSTPTASDLESRMSQARELLAEAQGELAQMGVTDNLDMDQLLQDAEPQIKAAAAAEADPDAPPPMPLATPFPSNLPRGRSRHRH
jgi:hypothetical protein